MFAICLSSFATARSRAPAFWIVDRCLICASIFGFEKYDQLYPPFDARLLVAYELESICVGSFVSGDWFRKLLCRLVAGFDIRSTICGHGTSVCFTVIPIFLRLLWSSVPVNSSYERPLRPRYVSVNPFVYPAAAINFLAFGRFCFSTGSFASRPLKSEGSGPFAGFAKPL